MAAWRAASTASKPRPLMSLFFLFVVVVVAVVVAAVVGATVDDAGVYRWVSTPHHALEEENEEKKVEFAE